MASRFAVGFDFDHTLGIDNQLERKTILEMLATFAREHDASYDVAAADGSVDELLATYRGGSLTPEIAIAGFIENFVPIPGSAIMDTVSHFRDTVVSRAKDFIEPIDGARELLAKLAEMHVPVGILTNGWSPFQEEKARLIQFAGPVLVSERIGVRKPSREAFAELVRHLGHDPVDTFYVGDDPRADCNGATDAGLQSVWLDREHKSYPSELAPPKFTIAALPELLAVLQGRG